MKKALFVLIYSVSVVFGYSQNTNLLLANDFENQIKNKDIQLLDVRTITEFNNGHIANALQADWNNPQQFQERTRHLDKSKPLYIYCQAGGRSAKAHEFLQNQGFTVFELKGGMTAWNMEKKPTEGQKKVAQISVEDYKKMIPAEGYTLIDFGAKWCAPCVKMEPIIANLATQYSGQFTLVKVDGAEQIEILKTLQIEAFPTFIVYKNGTEQWRHTGVLTSEELTNKLQLKVK